MHRLHRRPAIGDQLHLDAKEDDPSGLIQMAAPMAGDSCSLGAREIASRLAEVHEQRVGAWIRGQPRRLTFHEVTEASSAGDRFQLTELQARESTTTDLALPWIARAGFESPPRQAGVMLGCQLDVPSEKG